MHPRGLAIDPGDNTIEVVAYNGSNLLASLPARTTVKFTGPADKAKPKLHILAIGINAYVDKGWAPPGREPLGFGPLGLAVKDATVFAASMKEAAGGLYEDVRITLVLDRDATRDVLGPTSPAAELPAAGLGVNAAAPAAAQQPSRSAPDRWRNWFAVLVFLATSLLVAILASRGLAAVRAIVEGP